MDIAGLILLPTFYVHLRATLDICSTQTRISAVTRISRIAALTIDVATRLAAFVTDIAQMLFLLLLPQLRFL